MTKPICIIAEVGQAHDGSLGILHSYIDALAKTGVDVVKFQVHIAEAESSEFEPFRIPFSYEDQTRYDYWKRMEFTRDQWRQIAEHCTQAGVEFMASPFSISAVELLEDLDVKRYKIGSGEVTNHLLLEKIGRTGKPIILSSGLTSMDELDRAVEFLQEFGNNLSVLQCTTSYPTPYNQLGLNLIAEFRNRYPQCQVGLSEHTGQIYAGLAGAALGIDILEFHAVFDKRMFGPDAKASLTIDEIEKLVEGIRLIEEASINPVEKGSTEGYNNLKSIFEKSLAVNKSLTAGHILTFDDLESKKPANEGISAKDYRKAIGKRLLKNLPKWSFLREDDLET